MSGEVSVAVSMQASIQASNIQACASRRERAP